MKYITNINNSQQQNKDIYVLVDNLSTLWVFDRFEIKMCTLAECLDSLEYLTRANSVEIALDPIYEGDVCKAMARDQAKLGAINGTPLFTPKKVTIGIIEEHFADQWAHRWRTTLGCRQTKLWIQDPRQDSRWAIVLDWGNLSKLMQAITGHNYLRYHQFKLNESTRDKCRFCGGVHKEFVHLSHECMALTEEQKTLHMNSNFLDPPGFKSLIRFINLDRIDEAILLKEVEQK